MADQGAGWSTAGPAAEAYERHVARFMRPLVTAFLDHVGPSTDDVVLDVACGTGFVARELIERFGTPTVTGIDLDPGMLAAAQAGSAGVPTATWHLGSAQELPFDDGSFTLALCQQGLQFFPYPAGAIAEMARVVQPTGRVAATTWTPMATSPYMQACYVALEAAIGPEASASFRGAFRLTPADLRALFGKAGLRDVAIDEIEAEASLPTMDRYVVDQLGATPWGPLVRELPEQDRTVFVRRVASELEAYRRGDEIVVPFRTYVTTGFR